MKNSISLLRKEKNMTQIDLAKKVSVSRQTIISVENGKYNPSLKLAYNIAQVFNKYIEDIFDFNTLIENEEEDDLI